MVNKFIDYRSISTLENYLLIEPEYYHVTLIYRTHEGEWMAKVFNKKTMLVDLPKLNIQLSLEDIYFGLKWT